MTDDTESSEYSLTNVSRRTMMASAFGVPALGGITLAGLEVAARTDPSTLADATPARDGESAGSVTVKFPRQGHAGLAEQFTGVRLDPQLLDALGVSVGDQIRIRRAANEYALYTVVGTTQESDDTVVRMSRLARARLDLENAVWTNIEAVRKGCPVLSGTTEVATKTFDGVADSTVAFDDLDPATAQSEGELIEETRWGGKRFAALAPHGGDIEPGTDVQAEALADRLRAATSWTVKGYRPGSGAFLRWHVPTTQLSAESFVHIRDLVDCPFEAAVSFHGNCTGRVRVGGGASESVKTAVRDAIGGVLPDTEPDPVIGRGRYAATADSVLVNRISDGKGVWIGQPERVRDQFGDDVVDAVASVL